MQMKKLALLVAGVCALPLVAQADDSTVSIYGRLNVDFENVKTTGSTSSVNVSQRNRVSSNSSRLGFKGEEDLGGDLKAWFQVEQDLRVDGTTVASWSTRNTAVGLKGSFGTTLLGRWDTPYKVSTVKLDPWGDTTIASMQNVIGQSSSTPSGDFEVRQINTVQYWSPKISGFHVRAGYGANESKANSGTPNPSTWSVAGIFEGGPFYGALAYEKHKDSGILSAGNTGDDSGIRLGLGYKIAETQLGFIYEKLKYKTNAAVAVTELKRDAYFLALEQGFGGGNFLRATAALARKEKTNVGTSADTDAKAYSLGFAHKFSKRTEVYALYTKIDNKQNASYEFGVNTLAGVNNGADSTGWGVGIDHTF